MKIPEMVENNKNLVCIEVGPITLWFSYKTLIAFQINGNKKVVHQNKWSKTTDQHLNSVDGGAKENRHNSNDFNMLWNEQTKDIMVSGLFN